MDYAFKAMSDYRFFYANLVVLLNRDPVLKEKYVKVQQRLFKEVSQMLQSLRREQVLEFKDDELEEKKPAAAFARIH